jgi:hypothetical protein
MRTPGRFPRRPAAIVAAVSTLVVAGGAAPAQAEPTVSEAIADYRGETWRWQRLMGRPRTPYRATAERSTSEAYRQWVLALWKERALSVRSAAKNPPRLGAWLCIRRREGPWTANTGNGYYGGLQMDITFQRTYGAFLLRTKGRAHRWTPTEQIWIAERAYRSGRGFRPWPNTAGACGLL